jgi:uncharacterized protein (DUF983 family)
MALPRAFTVIRRGLCLRCPRCGAPGVFEGFWALRRFCRACHLRFEREQGYFIGAIYINYFATVSIVIPGYFVLDYWIEPALSTQLLLWGVVAALFPVVFFRTSKSLWLALGYLLSPSDED